VGDGRCSWRARASGYWRIAEKPDLTLRAVMTELCERGTPASYGAVWRFFKHEGVSFKKKPARQ
jgi:transposase